MHSYDHDEQDLQTESVDQTSDHVIWTGRPSQWVNLPSVLVNGFLAYGVVYGQWFLKGTSLAREYNQLLPYLDYAVNAVLLCLLLKVLYRALSVFYTKYELTTERLIEYTGITKFLQNGEPLELYNIYDYKFPPPFLMALFGKGSLILKTHDSNQPTVYLKAISDKRHVYEIIRKRVEVLRITKKSYFNGPSATS